MPILSMRRLSDVDHFLAPGLRVPSSVEIDFRGILADEPARPEEIAARLAEPPVHLVLVATFDEDLERYRTRTLHVDALEGEVSGTLLRRIRVSEISRMGLAPFIEAANADWPFHPRTVTEADLDGATRRGPSEAMLWAVAFVYRWAAVADDNPAAAVAVGFGLQARTATNWIRRARTLGMFERIAPGAEAGEPGALLPALKRPTVETGDSPGGN